MVCGVAQLIGHWVKDNQRTSDGQFPDELAQLSLQAAPRSAPETRPGHFAP